jgi:hypothetical protein
MSVKVTHKYNLVVSVRTYTDNEGKTKNVYKTIGELTRFKPDDGDAYLKAEIFHMPGVQISVFEQKEKEDKAPF